MKINKFLPILCLLISFTTLCAGQKKSIKVTGRVISEELKPLANVTIKNANNKFYALTDSSGYFQITLPRKYKKLIVQYLGYETDTIEVTATGPANSILFIKVFDGIEGYVHTVQEIEKYHENKLKRKQQLYEEAVRRKILE